MKDMPIVRSSAIVIMLALVNQVSHAVDPARIWSTYYGGIGNESGLACAVDADGNVYLAGSTSTTTGMASGGHQNTFGGGDQDAFLVKFSPDGARLWATYYGGANRDQAFGCAVDHEGNVYLAGLTASSAGIAFAGFDQSQSGQNDAFLVKFNTNGVRLWATYYGGTGDDYANACAVDPDGNVFIAGLSYSSSAIASGGQQGSYGGDGDGFLVKFSSTGTRLWGTYCGGAGYDIGWSVATDGGGNVLLAGITSSATGIAFGGHDLTLGGQDAFLVKYNASGVRQWGTYYGGSGADLGYACAVDANGNGYLAGVTGSAAGIAFGGHQNTSGGFDDAFLVKFDPTGVRQWATYYGGTNADAGYACAADDDGNVYLAGEAGSVSGIAAGGFQNTPGSARDAFLVKFGPDGTRSWGSYHGGNGWEQMQVALATTTDGVYIAGRTNSTDVMGDGGFQTTFSGGPNYDAYLTRITDAATADGSLAVRVFLGGAYNSDIGLMADALRAQGLVPLIEPYSGLGYVHVGGGGEETTAQVLAATGGNAIVDWVVLELRDVVTPNVRLATRACLLQRDGDVVEVDGSGPVSFPVPRGDYQVAVIHRNHLGVMHANPVALGNAPVMVDLTTTATATFGTDARRNVQGAFPAQVLWAGDGTGDGTLKYTGSGNDRDPILIAVGGSTPNAVVTSAYDRRDVNLDGVIKYTGSGNDRDVVLTNVGSTTPNAVRVQQLP